MDIDEIRRIKTELINDYQQVITDLGYSMANGISKKNDQFSLEIRLQPLEGAVHPIPDDLFFRIKSLIGKEYKGAPVNIKYIGIPKKP